MDEQNNSSVVEATDAATGIPSAAMEEAATIDAPDVEVSAGEALPVDSAVAADAALQSKVQSLQLLEGLGQDAIYLMGLSFILGSLFTVFVLLVLDFMRRNNNDAK